ncbi:beta-propeller fold lactonase family protein [Curvibacter sp. PAE-UM]|uniref:lactonase family protein n=1 Tax=Curvibacter sp. PAE-UM TaxID=1714344 RepID=UPI000709413D|nr:beta-propeller fold lactonase family protein [Curvibacter sp. PAE-UM]KRI01493.1 6-phosphogluconolactonase [Curvibacter sp. PAE-UM]
MSPLATVYVSNADSREISVLELDKRAGTLRALQTLPVGGMAMPLALSPDQKKLYVALRSEPYTAAAFTIDGATGQLSPLASAALPDSMAWIATDRSGRWLLAASYGGHRASISPIGVDGKPAASVQVIANGKNAHAAVPARDNRHVYITSLGTDEIFQWRFDATTGQLTPNVPPAMAARPGSGPRHLVLHPNGRHAYVLGELDASVELLDIDQQKGLLSRKQHWSTLPAGFTGKAWAADLHLTPDGRFLYTCERNSSTLAIWRVEPDSGMLTLVGHQPTEQQPRGFRIDASGQWLIAAGQLSHSVTLYGIDRDSGRLTPTHRLPVGKGPNWIEIVDRP